MSKHERTARVESVDENGVFRMTLASEGEASDGDILSMAGGHIPEQMPLLLSHFNDPTAKAGSVTDAVKELKHKPPRLRATGQIELGGVGALMDVRRDVAYMINKHGGAVSIRWDFADGGKQPVRRVNLPSDHPYFVDSETEKDYRKRWGYFWPEWKALEGSIVALGADSSAQIGGRLCAQRAEQTEGEVSTFWRAMADDAEANDGQAKIAASLAGLRIDARDCIEAGAEVADLINAVTDTSDDEFEPITISGTGRHFFVPRTIAEAHSSESFRATAMIQERMMEVAEPTAEEDAEMRLMLEEAFRDTTTERLDALEEGLTALQANAVEEPEERVSDAPLPSPEPERVEAEPLSAITSPRDLFAEIRKQFSEARVQHRKYVREEISRARGKVES